MADVMGGTEVLRFELPPATGTTTTAIAIRPPYPLGIVSASFIPTVDHVSNTPAGRTVAVWEPTAPGTSAAFLSIAWVVSKDYVNSVRARAFVSNELAYASQAQAEKTYTPGLHMIYAGSRPRSGGGDFPGGTLLVTVVRRGQGA